MQALDGSGGGLDVMEYDEEHKRPIYRPWKTRFDLQPFDVNSPNFMHPENRLGYRRFYASNPHLALAPNSRDRDAQSTVVMVFGLTALGAIIGAILIIDQLQILSAEELNLVNYQRKMVKVIIYAALPWLVLGAWLLTIFLAFVAHPTRYASDGYHWQCNAMVWFILLAPVINLFYFTSQALWVSKLSFSVEKQAPMGRMFSFASLDASMDQEDAPGKYGITRIFNFASHSVVRLVLFILEVACAIFGYLLITFRWGANSQFCQPEVYWTTTALVVTVAIIIVFTGLAFICSVLVRAFSISPWIQDFVESFWEAEVLARMRMAEKRAEKAQKEREAADKAQEDYNEWVTFHDEYEEDRQRHQMIMEEHAYYQAATKTAPPAREEFMVPKAMPVYQENLEDSEPLIVWRDDTPLPTQRSFEELSLPVPETIETLPQTIETMSQRHVTIQSDPVSAWSGSSTLPVPAFGGSSTLPVAAFGGSSTLPVASFGGSSTLPVPAFNTGLAPRVVAVRSGPIVSVGNPEQVYGSTPLLSGTLNFQNEEELSSAATSSKGTPREMPPGVYSTGFRQPPVVSSGMLPSAYDVPASPSVRPVLPGTLPLTSFQQPPVVSSGMLPSGYDVKGSPMMPSVLPQQPPTSPSLPGTAPGTLPLSSFRQPPVVASGKLPAAYGGPGTPSLPGTMIPATMPPSSFQQPPVLSSGMLPSGYASGTRSLPQDRVSIMELDETTETL